MNKNLLIVFGGAVVVAFLVAMLVQVTLGGKKKQEMQSAKAEVLVAAKDLSVGSEINADNVRWQEWPQAGLFPGAIVREGQAEAAKAVTGRLARAIAKGEPVMRASLASSSKGNLVAATLRPGMRAVAIEVSAAAMVGGFLAPGDHVDVMLTYKKSFKPKDEDGEVANILELSLDKSATETILQDIQVLAVDQVAKRPDDDKAKVAKTVTLAVAAQDAEKLALAQSMGDLTLSLRSVGDEAIVQKTWPTTSDSRLIKVDDELFSEYRKMQKDTGINPNIVRIYNGGSVEDAPTRGAPSSAVAR